MVSEQRKSGAPVQLLELYERYSVKITLSQNRQKFVSVHGNASPFSPDTLQVMRQRCDDLLNRANLLLGFFSLPFHSFFVLFSSSTLGANETGDKAPATQFSFLAGFHQAIWWRNMKPILSRFINSQRAPRVPPWKTYRIPTMCHHYR